MQLLKRIFSRTNKPQSPSEARRSRRPVAPSLQWREDTTYPIVDWKAAREQFESQAESTAPEDYWSNAAHAWLEALVAHLGDQYTVQESEHFSVLSGLADKQSKLAAEFCERSRRRILRDLEGIAAPWGNGPHVVMIFNTEDEYYEYIGNYYPKTGEFAMSSGMFIQQGYGHFVFVASDLTRMEPIIVHELTHCLLAPLPIPAWLNEGTAVNMENQLSPRYVDPRQGIFVHREIAQKRAAFWNNATIQEFWSGKSFKRPDEGCALSYDLAQELTRLIARDYAKYRAYMNSAERGDAGSQAAIEVLDFALGDLTGAVLGPGTWEPDPEAWNEGTERGQF